MSKEPWTVPGVPWKTEAAFWAWVRGVLRKGWSKHPVKIEFIKTYRKRIPNPNPKASKRFPEVWGMTCTKCNEDIVQSEIEIDHISEIGGKFTGLEDVRNYVEYLFMIDFSSVRCVCKTCHKAITYSQRMGISFEEAVATKKAIEFCKQDKKVVIDFLVAKGYNAEQVSSAPKRKKLVEKIFREEANVTT